PSSRQKPLLALSSLSLNTLPVTMATATSPNSLLLQNPNRSTTIHFRKNPNPARVNVFNLSPSRRNKSISITCSTAQVERPPSNAQSLDRVFNFAAGPATLPENVLMKAESELYNWRGSGMSVMEMSHRGKEFMSIIQKAESDLRALLNIPEEYAVLFLQGGATSQFAAIPLNLCKPDDPVDYVVTGSWGDKAFKEAQKFCKPSDYPTPKNNDRLLIADMSSNFCSKPVDVSKFGLIYAGAQKNVGPSGVTIVIVRKDLIGNAQEITPIMFDYKIHVENNSLYNTPPCYGIYMCGLVFEDLLAQGGLKEAAKEKMVQLKGHRSVGGMRASIYNAMPLAGVEKLVAFMKDFQARHA
ncbi:unnamed protein product, partial [Vitis vinifera]